MHDCVGFSQIQSQIAIPYCIILISNIPMSILPEKLTVTNLFHFIVTKTHFKALFFPQIEQINRPHFIY